MNFILMEQMLYNSYYQFDVYKIALCSQIFDDSWMHRRLWIFDYHLHKSDEATAYKSFLKIWMNKNYELHRDSGPAVIFRGYMCYYKNGKKHRDGGPAELGRKIKSMGFPENQCYARVWYKNGLMHRTDGPAYQWHSTKYYINGLRYRWGEFMEYRLDQLLMKLFCIKDE